jgi:hypothetical protein
MPAPIALFVYNRPATTRESLQALKKNEMAAGSTLFIFCDGPKTNAGEADIAKINEVRSVIREEQWCEKVEIIESPSNKGLARSIVEGVSKIVEEYGSIIVIEDDLVVSGFFLQYMNESLVKYLDSEEVVCIHGYSIPVPYNEPTFFLKGADCWGWATWRRGWALYNPDGKALLTAIKNRKLAYEFNYYNTFNYTGMLKKQVEGKINSWAILWYASAFLQNKLTLYPGHSMVKNIGLDESGTHPHNKSMMNTGVFNLPVALADIPVKESKNAKKKIAYYFLRKAGIFVKLKSIPVFLQLLFKKQAEE